MNRRGGVGGRTASDRHHVHHWAAVRPRVPVFAGCQLLSFQYHFLAASQPYCGGGFRGQEGLACR